MAGQGKEEKQETAPVQTSETDTETQDPSQLTAEEKEILKGDTDPPPGYANDMPQDVASQEEETETETEGKEENPEEKTEGEEKPSEEGKKPEETESETGTRDPIQRLEDELAKDEGKEDLSDFNEREKAYFFQMRRDRRSRQRAQQERDKMKFENIKLRKKGGEAPDTTTDSEQEDPFSGLQDRDPSDLLSVEEVLQMAEKAKAKPKPKPETEPEQATGTDDIDPVHRQFLVLSEKEARANHPDDFDAVLELADELINNDPIQLREVAKALTVGENPAEKMYQLIREHPEFKKLYPAAEMRSKAKASAKGGGEKEGKQGSKESAEKPSGDGQTEEEKAEAARKEREAEDAQDRLEKNSKKPKTTGHLSVTDTKSADQLTMEEIASMSDLEFAELPKAVRDRYLKLYG